MLLPKKKKKEEKEVPLTRSWQIKLPLRVLELSEGSTSQQ